ncbi:hypothetical protein BS47DRAFT_1373272 [Hydnum rufescens UP504]|uniref:Mitochondrial carrier n=1 Tax=Hydnum rufescens UP504 TaxID=1448309 RepID=A0A9P6ARS0_9AGAM|nr:hypothetical protein BS47DRAFT_1373272 [Hydnum rufescens UP504]
MSYGPSFFATPALDHAFSGIGAGTVAVLCMQPLDLVKVQFQVSTAPPAGTWNPLKPIYHALRNIKHQQGWRGLYRGLGPNVAGNATSWGFYFWFYTMIKHRMAEDDSGKLSSGKYLLASAEASSSIVTALITNPLWVVKVRMFTTRYDAPDAYRGILDGLRSIARTEGLRGLYRGTWLALFGVSSGAIQFMAYEQMKNFAFARKKRRVLAEGGSWREGEEKLSNTTYTIISALAKLGALTSTYPYQVIRSRLQNTGTTYPNFRTCIRRTWQEEGYKGFYRGLATNLVRVLPGTCVTFVVYENLAWALRTSALKREAARSRAKDLA